MAPSQHCKPTKDIRLRLWLAHFHLVCGDRDVCRAVVKEIARTGPAGAAESLGGDLPIVNYAGALIFLQLGRWNDAEKAAPRRSTRSHVPGRA